ncbi:MAG: hypothetical protein F6K11_04930 [Leptolyngbya sp. SIO3F4]|nr:hypothetical protein [Leptolyngbya sp. SIO3F4]
MIPSNKLHRFLLFVLFLSAGNPAVVRAQDTLTFLNGKQVVCASVQVLQDVVVAEVIRKRNTKTRPYAAAMVFSIAYADGSDTVLYRPDVSEDAWNTEEMRLFITGQQDARATYKTYAWGIAGFALGSGIGFLAYDQFYVLAVPVAYTVVAGLGEPKPPGGRLDTDSRFQQPAYWAGYMRVARNKKLFTALKTSVLGIALGVTIGNLSN